MKTKPLYGILMIFMILFGLLAGQPPVVTRAAVVQQDPPPAVDQAVEDAVLNSIAAAGQDVLGLLVFQVKIDHIQYIEEGSTALVWLALVDPQTGQVQGTEPALSIVHIQPNADPVQAASWAVSLPNSADWQEKLQALPGELLTADLRQLQEDQSQEAQADIVSPAAVETFTGYKLPWVKGKAVRLSGSIAHFLDYNSCSEASCRYAYDFADGTMFPLMAAKGGTVKAFVDSYENGNTTSTNYLVIEDQSTVPTTYQLYYHIAKNSVRFRTIGQAVRQGDYIADTDDTGYSTGHHLHFHVYKYPSYAGHWSWGNSVRILFDDVHFNGGEPRKCYEANTWPAYGTECYAGADGKRLTGDDDWLVSENTPANPPSASYSAPANRQVVQTASMVLSGTATDDVAIERILVQGNWNGTWTSLLDLSKPAINGAFTQNVNLCSAGVPDGPFSMMVKVWDREGSMVVANPGVVQLVKNFYCGNSVVTTPACQPGADEVAVYSQPNFLGSCKKLSARGTGYSGSELSPITDNSVASVQVGANVQAQLYDFAADMNLARPLGRIETFETSDVNLADNRLSSGQVSGVVVQARNLAPDEPFTMPPGARWDATGLGSSDSLVLSWEGGAGATSFNVTLKGPGLPANGEVWNGLTGQNLSIGTRPAGTYTWTVRSVNSAGGNDSSDPADPRYFGTFTIASSPLAAPQQTLSLPFNDSMESGENGWQKSGLWRLGSVTAGQREQTNAWIYNGGANIDSATYRAGDLTSPAINLPASSAYYLRFKYFTGVENDNTDWDQRRVQVLTATGSYLGELYQLSDDIQSPEQGWLDSPALSLAAYAGQTIRLRFHFNTVDQDYNSGLGWMIDDVSISGQGLSAGCLADGDYNNLGLAAAINIGSSVQADLCPQGDVDYFTFTGTSGQTIRVDIDARTLDIPSELDSQLYLLDADGRSVVAWNDDEELFTKRDSLLTFTLRRSGTYYLKVKDWKSPGAGGTNYPYTLRLEQVTGNKPKSISLITPADKNLIPLVPFEIVVQAADYDDGPVAQVDFYWHSSDWTNSSWVKIGTDSNGSNGWSYIIHPVLYGGVDGGALYVQAKNTAGAVLGLPVWDLKADVNTLTEKFYIPLLNR